MAKTNNWIFFLLFAISSCQSKGHWKEEHIGSGSSIFSSARLSYLFPDTNNGIHLEVLQIHDSYKGYLSVQSTPIPAYQDDPQKAKLSLQIGEKHFSYIVIRHEGGHRLVLPEEGLSSILEALSQGITVRIELSGYQSELSPIGFSSCFKKFQRSFKFPQVVQLPF